MVIQLTPSVVTNLSSTLSLQKHINRGREVHERSLESLHCYVGGIGTLISLTFSLEIILVLQRLEVEFLGEEKQQNQIKVS